MRGDWLGLLPDGDRPRLVPFLAHKLAGDPAAALLEVTGSESLRHQMRAAGLERARRFGWPQAARRVLESFDAVLSPGPHGHVPRRRGATDGLIAGV